MTRKIAQIGGRPKRKLVTPGDSSWPERRQATLRWHLLARGRSGLFDRDIVLRARSAALCDSDSDADADRQDQRHDGGDRSRPDLKLGALLRAVRSRFWKDAREVGERRSDAAPPQKLLQVAQNGFVFFAPDVDLLAM